MKAVRCCCGLDWLRAWSYAPTPEKRNISTAWYEFALYFQLVSMGDCSLGGRKARHNRVAGKSKGLCMYRTGDGMAIGLAG